nr:MAG TPA: hypothetical protein [Microviridae sp.]
MSKPILIISDERAINLLIRLYGVRLTPSVLAMLLRMPIESIRNLLALELDKLSKPVSYETDRA